MLGLPKNDATEKQIAKVPDRHAAFVEKVKALSEVVGRDAGLDAVLAFISGADKDALAGFEGWDTLCTDGGNMSFMLAGDTGLVCERPAIVSALKSTASNSPTIHCLVTDAEGPLAVLHPSIKGVRGAQSSGASLVSFNLSAFTSHGWEQGCNAPVSERAAIAYTAALNRLLARDNDSHHFIEGDTSFVFWAQFPTPLEEQFGGCFGKPEPEKDPDGKPVWRSFDQVRSGLRDLADDPTPFYVLGLAPNAARIAVRSWTEGTAAQLATRIQRHFDDLMIVGLDKEGAPPPSVKRILGAAARAHDPKTLPESLYGVLAADLVRAALEGIPYPATLLARSVERCRAEQSVSIIRAAVIKAVLIRRNKETITMALDPNNTNPGYLLGRLFAVLENIQKAANPGINTTIRDRYFGAASAAPRSVFVELMRLKNAHLKKVKRQHEGYAVRYEKLIAEIAESLSADEGFPAHLALDDQGRFILGYHHQTHDLYTKRSAEA